MSEYRWGNADQSLVGLVNEFHSRCVEVYKQDANRVHEDAGKERGIAEGGYGRKQIQELVQNSSDALRQSPGRIQVTLTGDTLYVANEGLPFEAAGVRALLYTHLSNKTGGEIGRFGLGFKSISGISDRPQIFSRSVAFEFNRQETASELSREIGEHLTADQVPALRIAWNLDAVQEFQSDGILAELAEWATTVVKVPLLENVALQLSAEISGFDESFSLFAPHVRQLDLRDDIAGVSRGFTARKRGNRVVLTTEEGEREWLVFSREHRPSAKALESAGHSARRESVEVSWAVPTTGKVAVGQLSAFFPVESLTSLSGRINAPWKLSDDRINVIECAFNFELLTEVLPALVVDARKELVAENNYGRYIDVLPARGRETRSWSDGVLNEPVYEALRGARSLPDLDGQLKTAGALRCVPSELVGEHVERWLEVAGDRETWVHPACTANNERRSKVERLMAENKNRVGRLLDWLHSAVVEPTPEHSAVAVEIASRLQSVSENARLDVRDSRIVLLENGTLQQPVTGRCFIRSDSEQKGTAFVEAGLTSRPQTLTALEHLGITPFDSGGQMLQLLADLATSSSFSEWDALWSAMRGSGEAAVREGFDRLLRGKASSVVHVRDGRGRWVLPTGLYLAGDCLKQLREDSQFLVDGDYHATDREILGLLGVRTRPTHRSGAARERWVSTYVKDLQSAVGDSMGLSFSARERLSIEIESVLGPLQLLPELSQSNKTALSVAAAEACRDPRVRVSHPQVSKPGRFVSPEMWWLRQHGVFPTTLGPLPVDIAFVPSADVGDLRGLLPVVVDVDLSEDAIAVLGLRTNINSLDADAFGRLVSMHVNRDDSELVGRVYAWWCHTHQDQPPTSMWVKVAGNWQEMPRNLVAVATTVGSLHELEEFGIPCVQVDTPEDAWNLRELWGCLEGRGLPLSYLYETSAEPVIVVDAFDVFDDMELDDDPEDLTLQKCLSISKIATVPGRPEMRVDCQQARAGNTLLVTGNTDRRVLKQIPICLEADSSDEQVEAYLLGIERKRNTKQIREIRRAKTDEERLLLFAGEERLKTLIPRDALDYVSRTSPNRLDGIGLASVCTTMLGTRALERVCKADPKGLPIAPPSTWHGSFATRRWVRDLGFGEEWAGAKTLRRNKPTEYVDGPADLSPFHDYQQAVSDKLLGMLIGDGPNRGIISLPTGAGKTRVAVETIIYAIRGGALDNRGGLSGPILWLADGEELCEQAIDAWSYLWRAQGRSDSKLIVSRFWSNYETEEENGGVQVVVATWQKIVSRAVGNPDFAWLADCPLVVIDEAHAAIHSSYTRILEWCDRSNAQRDKPLLGLTATPFRGRRDSDDTKWLLNRFDNNILDDGVFGAEMPQVRLQRDRVLARARLEILDGATNFELTDAELAEFRKNFWMPRNAERRLGRDAERTHTIVESILSKPDDWPIVVFAASVEAAQTLATLLTLAGRPAASIDQDTSPDDRRLAVDRFKSGELKVLTNYAVLSQGFDAPLTRAVYITRPTSSEVRYQQMVGRGLRGPKNGGSEEVLIVNVLDNVVEFGDSIVCERLKEITDAEQPESDAVGA